MGRGGRGNSSGGGGGTRRAQKKTGSNSVPNKPESESRVFVRSSWSGGYAAPSYVEAAASKAHEAWQENWRAQNGDEPRWKETKDQTWIDAHGTNQVDLTTTDYENLPKDWQEANKQGALSAGEALNEQKMKKGDFDMEEAAAYVHGAWLENNSWARGGDLDVPYEDLPEAEKEKDREFIRLISEQEVLDKLKKSQKMDFYDSPEITNAAAAVAHEAWQADWRKQNGDEPRWKETGDQAWIDANGTNQVDLTTTDYKDLPEDWKKSNLDSCVSAAKAIDYLGEDDFSIDKAAARVHDDWLLANEWAKGGELDVPYNQLPEAEKEKDREFVRSILDKKTEFDAAELRVPEKNDFTGEWTRPEIMDGGSHSSPEVIAAAASEAHRAWQDDWRAQHGDEPRWKETTDKAWIDAHGTNQVDLTTTDYAGLPEDWQKENRGGAESAAYAIDSQMASGKPFDIEKASSLVHEEWLDRNPWAQGGELDVPYEQLSEIEKQKDREFVLSVMSKRNEAEVSNGGSPFSSAENNKTEAEYREEAKSAGYTESSAEQYARDSVRKDNGEQVSIAGIAPPMVEGNQATTTIEDSGVDNIRIPIVSDVQDKRRAEEKAAVEKMQDYKQKHPGGYKEHATDLNDVFDSKQEIEAYRRANRREKKAAEEVSLTDSGVDNIRIPVVSDIKDKRIEEENRVADKVRRFEGKSADGKRHSGGYKDSRIAIEDILTDPEERKIYNRYNKRHAEDNRKESIRRGYSNSIPYRYGKGEDVSKMREEIPVESRHIWDQELLRFDKKRAEMQEKIKECYANKISPSEASAGFGYTDKKIWDREVKIFMESLRK